MEKETKKHAVAKKIRKPLLKEVTIGSFGIATGMHFHNNKAYVSVALNQSELKRIAKELQVFINEKFPKDSAYIKAIDTVVKKLERKNHALRITEDVLLGSRCIKFDHLTGKESPFDEDK